MRRYIGKGAAGVKYVMTDDAFTGFQCVLEYQIRCLREHLTQLVKRSPNEFAFLPLNVTLPTGVAHGQGTVLCSKEYGAGAGWSNHCSLLGSVGRNGHCIGMGECGYQRGVPSTQ